MIRKRYITVLNHWIWNVVFAAYFVWFSYRYNNTTLTLATGVYLSLVFRHLFELYMERKKKHADDV